ncbi:hypothetical protein AAFF_G00140990 [Aldrovandia affinis]|uniref:Uncharacterized protein n=1 Tax=Aldrovandia affinis TaxID=143900 RepID=A0AAD7TCH0_9TELE|nr:hypothetical protein AAFF_G00140990 [Aldrovandia affinis]
MRGSGHRTLTPITADTTPATAAANPPECQQHGHTERQQKSAELGPQTASFRLERRGGGPTSAKGGGECPPVTGEQGVRGATLTPRWPTHKAQASRFERAAGIVIFRIRPGPLCKSVPVSSSNVTVVPPLLSGGSQVRSVPAALTFLRPLPEYQIRRGAEYVHAESRHYEIHGRRGRSGAVPSSPGRRVLKDLSVRSTDPGLLPYSQRSDALGEAPPASAQTTHALRIHQSAPLRVLRQRAVLLSERRRSPARHAGGKGGRPCEIYTRRFHAVIRARCYGAELHPPPPGVRPHSSTSGGARRSPLGSGSPCR